MIPERIEVRLAVVAIAALILGTHDDQQACAQIEQDSIVLGRSEETDSFRVYDGNTWSNGPGWSPTFMQSIEFDNSGGISHNASGNLLAANFGNSFTGFELHNLATDGTNISESVWSIVDATGGTKGENPVEGPGGQPRWLSQRGGGVSVSPDNSLLAWTNFDSGEIYVHDYSAGDTIGAGGGTTLSGPRRTGLGDGNGNAGGQTALSQSVSQGTAWLSNTTLVAFNGFGELITLDVSGHPGGSEDGTFEGWMPTEMTDWVIASSEVAFSAQFTDVEYNPLIDPDHIYAAVTKQGTFEAELFAYNYDVDTGNISLDTRMVVPPLEVPDPDALREPREIAFDSEGNLFFSGYAGDESDNIIMRFPNATDIAGWNAANVEVFYSNVDYTGFNGMDVAASIGSDTGGLLGDYNDDGILNAADYTVWRDALGVSAIPNAPTGGVAEQADYDYWKDHFGESLSSTVGGGTAVPEPGTLTLIVLFMCTAAAGRRHGVRDTTAPGTRDKFEATL